MTGYLARGVLGFGLIGGAVALAPVLGFFSLLLLPPALVLFRGCPTCWVMGLVRRRGCADGSCRLPAPR